MEAMNTQETMSALADGQLHGAQFAQGVVLACEDAQARQAWHCYHLIGDVLRSGELAAATAGADFMASLSQRLAQEPPLTPGAIDDVAAQAIPVRSTGQFAQEPAANDGSFRWKVVAGVASLAAVAAIGWGVASPQLGGRAVGPQLAAAPAAQPANAASAATLLARTPAGPMLRDPRLDELLAAHRQLGSGAAVQMPAGFLRNATYEQPER